MHSNQASFVVIGRWDDPSASKLTLQDFIIEGRSTIPIFSDEASFKQQATGTPFERDGLVIAGGLLLSMLKDDDRLILDPGSRNAMTMTKAQFVVHIEGNGGVSVA